MFNFLEIFINIVIFKLVIWILLKKLNNKKIWIREFLKVLVNNEKLSLFSLDLYDIARIHIHVHFSLWDVLIFLDNLGLFLGLGLGESIFFVFVRFRVDFDPLLMFILLWWFWVIYVWTVGLWIGWGWLLFDLDDYFLHLRSESYYLYLTIVAFWSIIPVRPLFVLRLVVYAADPPTLPYIWLFLWAFRALLSEWNSIGSIFLLV